MRHRAAVIGKPVAHSLSPLLHAAAYESLGLQDWDYTSVEVDPQDLAQMLELLRAASSQERWEGLSVTMPHKQRMLPMLDILDPLTQVVGAANTVIAQRSGTGRALLAGFNTDVAGIVGAFREYMTPDTDVSTRAVILGSGATASSALAALAQLGAGSIAVVARNHAGPQRAAAAAHRMGLEIEQVTWRPDDPASHAHVAALLAQASLVVSTLPAGAADPIAQALICHDGSHPGGVLLDVVYAPWPTALARAWQEAGGMIAPGWLMLLYQAVDQVRLMTGHTPEIEPMRRALVAAVNSSL